jgi:hypothetical protein
MATALLSPAHSAGTRPAPVDLSGFWELRDDSKHVPNAQVVEAFKSADGQRKFNDLVLYASRWCHPLGTPFIMGDSAPLDLIQGKQELAITAEVQSSARHIYLDGRAHPDPDEFDPTTNGHSIGHWEGNVLVVDTTGFNEVGNRSIPGGGMRGSTSHLVERYELRKSGTELNVEFTWTDPNVFAEPHVYDFTYYKTKPGEYAREYFCDASDPARGESVHPPQQ